jgi:hypothetical protein
MTDKPTTEELLDWLSAAESAWRNSMDWQQGWDARLAEILRRIREYDKLKAEMERLKHRVVGLEDYLKRLDI